MSQSNEKYKQWGINKREMHLHCCRYIINSYILIFYRNENSGIGGKRCTPQKPQFGLRWKMFELDGCEVTAKHVLHKKSNYIDTKNEAHAYSM